MKFESKYFDPCPSFHRKNFKNSHQNYSEEQKWLTEDYRENKSTTTKTIKDNLHEMLKQMQEKINIK